MCARMRQVISLARYWNKVLASPVRNQTLIFSDADMPGHRQRMAAFASVAERWFGQVRALSLSIYIYYIYIYI